MSMNISGNYNPQIQNQPQKNNTGKKIAGAAAAIAAVGTGVYLAKSGKGSELVSKLRTNLEAYGIGKKILGITDKITEKAGAAKEKVSNAVKDLHLGEKAETIKKKVVESPAYQKAGELKTKAKTEIKELKLGEKVKDVVNTIKEKIHNADIPGKIKGLAEKAKGLFTKAA